MVAGRAAILVPFPHAVDDHQTANARFLTDAGAAQLLPQHELTRAVLRSCCCPCCLIARCCMRWGACLSHGAAATRRGVADVCEELAA